MVVQGHGQNLWKVLATVLASAIIASKNSRCRNHANSSGAQHVMGHRDVVETYDLPISAADIRQHHVANHMCAWFTAYSPQCLHLCLCLSTYVHCCVYSPSAGSITGLMEVEEQEFVGEPDGSVEELIDSMSCAFYSLAATGTVRVGRLCKGPQLLACWALELLEEQACHVSALPPPPPPSPPLLPMLRKLQVAFVLCLHKYCCVVWCALAQ